MKGGSIHVLKTIFIVLCSVIVMVKGVHDENNLEETRAVSQCLRKKYFWQA
jgi:hypothetical protein